MILSNEKNICAIIIGIFCMNCKKVADGYTDKISLYNSNKEVVEEIGVQLKNNLM
jgi:hypothetical protein